MVLPVLEFFERRLPLEFQDESFLGEGHFLGPPPEWGRLKWCTPWWRRDLKLGL